MSEQQEVIADLDRAGVLSAVRWAYSSAMTGSMEVYSEPAGHDHTFLGIMRHTLLRDRLDRVFSCEKYAIRSDDSGAALDLLFAELTDRDVTTMPSVPPGLVRRFDFNRSPGWAHEHTRFLLASSPFGELDRMPWPQMSLTKQRVARQEVPYPDQLSLLEEVDDEQVADLYAAFVATHALDMTTLVVAHSLDPMTGRGELALGRPRLNRGGGPAWHWRYDLLAGPPADGTRGRNDTSSPIRPNTVPDAPVRLRSRPAEQGSQAGDER